MRFTTRQLVILAVFGALWGVVEISLGAVLHALNLPMSGVFLSAIGLLIALIGRVYVPRPGSTLFIGVIATILKLFSIGSVVIGPMAAIIMEAFVAELVLTSFKKPSRMALVAAGSLGVTWTLVHPFITNPLLFGRGIFIVWLDILDRGTRLLGLNSDGWVWIILAMFLIHFAIGAAAGWLGWKIAAAIQLRNLQPFIQTKQTPSTGLK